MNIDYMEMLIKELNQKGAPYAEITAAKEKLAKLKGEHHYVYVVAVDGELRYVGKGSDNRWKHAISGTSSVKMLNKAYFEEKHIEVFRWRGGMTSKQAMEEERMVMLNLVEFHDLYNNLSVVDKSRHFETLDVSIDEILYSCPKLGQVNEPDKSTLEHIARDRYEAAMEVREGVMYDYNGVY